MSVRAYKIITKELADDATFGFRDNQEIINLADSEYSDGNGSYFLYYNKSTIEDELENTDPQEDVYELLKLILKDIGDDDYIYYECY